MARSLDGGLVLVAAVWLLACGGRYAAREGGGDQAGTSAGGSESAGGTMSGSAGGMGSASAGSSAVGGALQVSYPPDGQGQWVCGSEVFDCTAGIHQGYPVDGFYISKPCASDPKRPKSAADCAPDQSFDCLVGFIQGQMALFNCQCTERAASMCQCPPLKTECSRPDPAAHYCDGSQTVCACLSNYCLPK